ncbi:MAG: hypothetical protein OK442_00040 [Thaumarchaeota archaeon]|nr:hypothetical protein [Nitrososphaerota archaeon]
MTSERAKPKEAEEAVEYLRDLRKDPVRFEAWVDRLMKGWLKRKRASSQRSPKSKRS